MKETELNPFNQNQRKLLQIGVVILLALFLGVYFFLINQKPTAPAVKNSSVYIQNGKLYLFDETLPEPQYPSHLLIHYPYLLLVKPEQNITSIYNLTEKKKDKDVKEILLDYDGTNELYSKGKTTLFNTQDLGILCQYGWIKSDQEVLCVTQIYTNYDANKLININVSAKTQKDIYVSKDRLKVITALSIINDNIYLGEIYPFNNTNYLIINNQNPIEVPSPVSMIYQMNNQPYFISYKNALNNLERYYLIQGSNISSQNGEKIYIFK